MKTEMLGILRVRVKTLEKVLEPFAKAADQCKSYTYKQANGKPGLSVIHDTAEVWQAGSCGLLVGDLRRAAEVLRKTKNGGT